MHILYPVGSPESLGPVVCAVSTFDGVHLGHVALARRVADLARAQGVPAVAVVVWEGEGGNAAYAANAPHRLAGQLLTLLDERLALLEALGAFDAALVLSQPPDAPALTDAALVAAVARLARPVAWLRLAGEPGLPEPEDARRWDVLPAAGHRDGIPASSGRDGLDLANGPVEALAHGRERDTSEHDTDERPTDEGEALEHMRDGARNRNERIAELLRGGDVRAAAELLGRPYRVGGVVVSGDRRGRLLGYPTANLRLDGRTILPADGIYAVRAQLPGERGARHPAVVSLGVRPQFGAGMPRLLEVYLLDGALDLYGLPLVVEFVERLREERRFTDVEALKAQMARDVARARELLGERADVRPAGASQVV